MMPAVSLSKSTEGLVRTATARLRHELMWLRPWSRPFTTHCKRRVLMITEGNTIAGSQIHPFWFYRWELERQGVELREVNVEGFAERPERAPGGATVVVLQPWFTISRKRLDMLLDAIETHNPDARVVFFDSSAPTDLRMASWLGDRIDLYVKKNVLSDRSQYYAPTLGDTNLTDYYQRLYTIEDQEFLFPIPDGFFSKLLVGPGFFTGEGMLRHFFSRTEPRQKPKTLDVHARLGANGKPWYSKMRGEALRVLDQMQDLRVVKTSGVQFSQYLSELAASRICLSPFGYGEIAWRDYEAVMCGALLLKPDMSHCDTDPSIFIPYETYIPTKWDFSDTAEKIRYYIDHPKEADQITRRAFTVLHEYCKEKQFLRQMGRVIDG
jgi:hypothetical protein